MQQAVACHPEDRPISAVVQLAYERRAAASFPSLSAGSSMRCDSLQPSYLPHHFFFRAQRDQVQVPNRRSPEFIADATPAHVGSWCKCARRQPGIAFAIRVASARIARPPAAADIPAIGRTATRVAKRANAKCVSYSNDRRVVECQVHDRANIRAKRKKMRVDRTQRGDHGDNDGMSQHCRQKNTAHATAYWSFFWKALLGRPGFRARFSRTRARG